jgi:hypothetical protein
MICEKSYVSNNSGTYQNYSEPNTIVLAHKKGGRAMFFLVQITYPHYMAGGMPRWQVKWQGSKSKVARWQK